MTKFLFENKELKEFRDCNDEEKLEIINADTIEECLSTSGARNITWAATRLSGINYYSIYRVLAPEPTPNEIDWSQVPPEYKYLYSVSHGNGMLTDRLPVEAKLPGVGLCLGLPRVVRFVPINEGDFGFKRGTVESIDSLLIRPIGE